MAPAVDAYLLNSTKSQLHRLVVAQLKEVLRAAGLPLSGAKAVLQDRIESKLDELYHKDDAVAFRKLRDTIIAPCGPKPSPTSASVPQQPLASLIHTPTTPTQGGFRPFTQQYLTPQFTFNSDSVAYRKSPFYETRRKLVPTQECKIREQTRDGFKWSLQLDEETVNELARDENSRVFILCAAAVPESHGPTDIAFPNQIEIRVNRDDIKANLRGLKNKPGSTRPADITSQLHRRPPKYPNEIDVTYALTAKRYLMDVCLVKKIAPEALVRQLKSGRSISKDQVLREMRSKARDTDVVATSSVMSLKCPLSTHRIDTPCRSMTCTHNQCFDALFFLRLQEEQAPTWTCPVCNKSSPFTSLQIDRYVEDILQSTSSSVEQVLVEPDGNWSTISPSDDQSKQSGHDPDDDDDDSDLVEIQTASKPSMAQVSVDNTAHSAQAVSHPTPASSSREMSSASVHPRPSSNKRPAYVIDLTLDDDDDDPPPLPSSKRQSTYPTGMQYFPGNESPVSPHPFNNSGRSNTFSFTLPNNLSRPRNYDYGY